MIQLKKKKKKGIRKKKIKRRDYFERNVTTSVALKTRPPYNRRSLRNFR